MKLLIVSDTHGKLANLEKAINSQLPIDLLIHLGDGEKEVSDIKKIHPNLKTLQVKGNCDVGSKLNSSLEYTLLGKKLFITHGHDFGVKSSLYPIFTKTKELNADILLFGHTHQPFHIFEQGIFIMNPGSLGAACASYGIINIEENTVEMKLQELN